MNCMIAPAFMAPELCENKSFSGQLADIWAIGVTIFMLKFGHPPFVAKNIVNLYYKISNDPLVFPYSIDPGLRNLIEGLLDKDPEKRMSMAQIVAHPWFRFPPSTMPKIIPSVRTPLAKQDVNPLKTTSVPTVAALCHSNSSAETQLVPGSVGLSFQPPPNYDEEEEAAMRAPIHSASINEVFMSIGGIRQLSDANLNIENAIQDIDVEDDVDDDDDEEEDVAEVTSNMRSNEKTEGKKVGRSPNIGDQTKKGDLLSLDLLCSVRDENMMNTNWGDDVFQIVDDGDDGDDGDDVDFDEDDDGDEKNDEFAKMEKKENDGPLMLTGAMFSTTHTEMSADEENRRSKQFLKKSALKKSSNQLRVDRESDKCSDKNSSGSSNVMSSKSPNRNSFHTSSPPHHSFSASKRHLPPARNHSDKIPGISRENNLSHISLISQNDFDDADAPEQLSNEEFSRLMDTLAQQPSKAVNLQKSSMSESYGTFHDEEMVIEEKSIQGLLEFLIAPYQNNKNEVGCACISEQGRRPSQEDRFVVNTSLLSYFQEHSLLSHQQFLEIPNLREQLSQLSLFGIFDGHSGSKTSHFLSHNFVKRFVENNKFLDSKTLELVVNDAFLLLDYEVCAFVLFISFTFGI
jgi:serine/threonine protein kinase